MDATTIAVEAQAEPNHWWFVGRRRLFAAELRRLSAPCGARILDVGTGTGANLRLLRDLGFRNVVGLDASDDAIRYCASKGLGSVRKGDLCTLPFADRSFELVLATDVLEHVDDDYAAAREIMRVLVPGGTALVTVPAFQMLWGLQDRLAFHKRRYRQKQFVNVLGAAGLAVKRTYYFNYILFVPILAARRLIDVFRLDLSSENEVNSPLINKVLGGLFAIDVSTAPWMHPPSAYPSWPLSRSRPRDHQRAAQRHADQYRKRTVAPGRFAA